MQDLPVTMAQTLAAFCSIYYLCKLGAGWKHLEKDMRSPQRPKQSATSTLYQVSVAFLSFNLLVSKMALPSDSNASTHIGCGMQMQAK